MGVPVSKLIEQMDHKEMLYHLHDLEQDMPIRDYLNLLFAKQTKHNLDFSMLTEDSKRGFKLEDFMLKFKQGEDKPKMGYREIARRNKYKGLIL